MVRCSTGELYTGCTVNIERRVKQHNAGVGARFTRTRRPVALVYRETCSGQSAALKRERQIKNMSRRQKDLMIQRASATAE